MVATGKRHTTAQEPAVVGKPHDGMGACLDSRETVWMIPLVQGHLATRKAVLTGGES
jgi:hypothetical protein